jgi:hypothetical protein
MNLRSAKGKVPIKGRGETPFLLIDFPNMEVFKKTYKGHANNIEMYWDIVNRLSNGMTMVEAGQPYALTRERVRQIEAKFIRLLGQAYWEGIESNLSILSTLNKRVALMTETQQTSLPSDDNH